MKTIPVKTLSKKCRQAKHSQKWINQTLKLFLNFNLESMELEPPAPLKTYAVSMSCWYELPILRIKWMPGLRQPLFQCSASLQLHWSKFWFPKKNQCTKYGLHSNSNRARASNSIDFCHPAWASHWGASTSTSSGAQDIGLSRCGLIQHWLLTTVCGHSIDLSTPNQKKYIGFWNHQTWSTSILEIIKPEVHRFLKSPNLKYIGNWNHQTWSTSILGITKPKVHRLCGPSTRSYIDIPLTSDMISIFQNLNIISI